MSVSANLQSMNAFSLPLVSAKYQLKGLDSSQSTKGKVQNQRIPIQIKESTQHTVAPNLKILLRQRANQRSRLALQEHHIKPLNLESLHRIQPNPMPPQGQQKSRQHHQKLPHVESLDLEELLEESINMEASDDHLIHQSPESLISQNIDYIISKLKEVQIARNQELEA